MDNSLSMDRDEIREGEGNGLSEEYKEIVDGPI